MFCKKYLPLVEGKTSLDINLRYIASLLSYYGVNTDFRTPDEAKYVLGAYTYCLCVENNGYLSLRREYEKSLDTFKRNKLLLNKVEVAV